MNFADKVLLQLGRGTRIRVLLDTDESDIIPPANIRAFGPGWLTLDVNMGGEALVVAVDTERIVSVSCDRKDVPAGE